MLEHFWKQELMNQVPHNTWNLIQLHAIIQNIHLKKKKHTRSLDTQWLRQIVKQILGALNMTPHGVHSPTNQQAMCSYMPNNLRMSWHIPHVYSLLWNYALVHCKVQWTPAVFPHPFSELTLFMVCKTTFGHNRQKLFKRWMLFLRPHLTS